MKVFYNHKATTGVCKKSFIDTKKPREDSEFLRKVMYFKQALNVSEIAKHLVEIKVTES